MTRYPPRPSARPSGRGSSSSRPEPGPGLVVYAGSRTLRVLAPLYPAVVVFAILATGNHFVLDALAGALAMAVGLGLALISRAFPVVPFRQRRGVEQPGSSPGS